MESRDSDDEPAGFTSGGVVVDEVLLAELREAMVEADMREALREFELAHVVVCFDPISGYLTVEGPYEDGLAAVQMAEEDSRADQVLRAGFTYLVLPLLPQRGHP
jgi:hypothetical protein